MLQYDSNTGTYDVVDVDDERALRLPETQVIALDNANAENMRRLVKNDEVLVVYPDTSTFYPAILSQAPKRMGAALGMEPTALVQFIGDDPDETGVIPSRSVLLKYVIKPPSC